MRRDERSGLERLYTLIEQDKAGAVAAFDVSRLYRVLSRAEYGAFCDLVLERRIPVVTFHRIYWPTRVDNDQLNDDFKAAAMFIEDIIKGKLIAGKNRHIEYDTSYGGGSHPMGYIVLGMGDDSVDKKSYIIYEPHASLIRWIFKRFRELRGSVPALARELKRIDFRFPAFPSDIPHWVSLKPDADGTYPLRTRDAIIGLLLNRAYIGYYIYGGMLVSKQAHDPIVPLDDFMYAYERLSRFSLDGDEIQERKPRERRRGTDALLDGIISCGELTVYVTGGKYEARAYNEGFITTELAVAVSLLDGAFSQAMIATLATLEDARQKGLHQALTQQVEALMHEQEQAATNHKKAIARIDTEIDNAEMAQRVSKELGDEQGYSVATKDLVQLRKDRQALEAKADQADSEAEDLAECHDLIECAVQDWKGMSIGKRKRLVKLLCTDANVTEVSPHFIKLNVELITPDSCSLTVYLYRAHGSRNVWTNQEDATLAAMFASESKQAIMGALPQHSWTSTGLANAMQQNWGTCQSRPLAARLSLYD